jgi:glycosyltransferase involved in cell wall biosynthesis
MRVNIISNHRKHTGLLQDANILRGLLTVVFEDQVEAHNVQYTQPQCQDADVNIFLEVVNPALFPYAQKNIWIPNHEWTYRTWLPYLHMMDEIWVKTEDAGRMFRTLTKTRVRYIGWTSLPKEFCSNKDYTKAIVPLGKNMYREINVLFEAYLLIKETSLAIYADLPELHVVSWRPVDVPAELVQKVTCYKNLSQEEYDSLLNRCGLCICLSKAEGFGHAVVEAMSSGCSVMLSRLPHFLTELVGECNPGSYFCDTLSATENTDCFGTLLSTDVNSVVKNLHEYVIDLNNKETFSSFVRSLYEHNHKEWLSRMKVLLPATLKSYKTYSLKDTMPKEDELPNVSIVCVTRDRRIFMPILKYSYMIQSYPEDKLELVIVDDGKDSIEDTLIGVPNVVYIRLDTPLTIGEKRNIGIEKAMYDVITFMDDDDIYPNNSVLERTAMLLKSPKKECAFCSVIPCYDIANYSSFMNAPPLQLGMPERVSEATLIFTRTFWENGKFENKQIAEGDAFVRGREHMCRELSPQEVIVSLVHPLNTSSRKLPEIKEPNGCHFGFNEKLFAMVSEIGETLKAEKATH